jgi:hypothetical protein
LERKVLIFRRSASRAWKTGRESSTPKHTWEGINNSLML